MFLNSRPTDGNAQPLKEHWVVRMNHRNRTWGFLALGLVIGMHIAQKMPDPLLWSWLLATYLLYPQLAWLVSKYSKNPLRQELWHMRLDAWLCGAWAATLHFPLWIAFTLFITVLLNLTLFRGWRGLWEAFLAWMTGALLLGFFSGGRVDMETDGWVTGTTLAMLSLFLIVTALDNQQRSMRLHQMRLKLRSSQQGLQRQLEEISGLQNQLKEQALRDSLTGLFNRYRLSEVLHREIERCKRAGQSLSLLLIDIDHFKNINDRWGHQVGDEVLRQVAERLERNTRAGDWCFRYGGEEFLLILPQADMQDAWLKADLLRQRLAADPLLCGDQAVDVRISAGLSTYPDHGADLDALLGSADRALYQAKREGRNRVVQGQS